jgi:hypothetical protein
MQVPLLTLPLSFLAIALTGIAFLVLPETIPAGGGFGYDGVTYAKMVAEIESMIATNELSTYYAQRILPALLVKSGLWLFDLPASPENIILGFRVLNFSLLAACALFWFAIARELKLSTFAYWVGFAGLFACFPNAKQAFYYPVLTDTFAFFIGCALALAYLKKNLLSIAIISLVGSFAWQMSAQLGVLLLLSFLVSFQSQILDIGLAQFRIKIFKVSLYRLIIFGFLFASLTLGVLLALSVDLGLLLRGRSFAVDPFKRLLTNLPTIFMVAFGLAYVLECLLSAKPKLSVDKKLWLYSFVLVAALFLTSKFVISQIGNPDMPQPGGGGMIGLLIAMLVGRVSEGMVLLPLVSHFVYYGPVILLLLLAWPLVVQQAFALGAGFVVVITMFSVLSIFSESRFTFMLWPFVVLVVASASEKISFSRLAKVFFFGLAVFLSKIWLQLNQAEWPQPDYALLNAWPKSLYFSHLGPWMNWDFYVLQGLFALLCILVFSWFFSSSPVSSLSFGRRFSNR